MMWGFRGLRFLGQQSCQVLQRTAVKAEVSQFRALSVSGLKLDKNVEFTHMPIEKVSQTESDIQHEAALKGLITIEGKVDVATTSVSNLHLLIPYYLRIRPAPEGGGFLNIFTAVWRLAFSGNALPIYEVIFFCLQL